MRADCSQAAPTQGPPRPRGSRGLGLSGSPHALPGSL